MSRNDEVDPSCLTVGGGETRPGSPEERRRESRNSVLFLGCIVVGFGITAGQNFYFAYVTSERLFGEITLVLSTFFTLNTLFLAGLDSAVIRYYFDPDAFESPRSLLSHLAAFWALSGGVLLLVFLVGGYFVLQVHHLLPLRFFPSFVLIAVGSLLFSFVTVFQNVFIATKEPLKYGLILISSRLLLFVGLAASLPRTGGSLTPMCMAAAASAALAVVVSVPVLRLVPFAPVDLRKVLRLAPYTLPLGLNSLGGIGFSHGYKVVLASSLTLRDLGLFNIATQFSMAYYMVAASLLNAYTARAYNNLAASGGQRRSIRFYLGVVIGVGLLVAVIVTPATYLFLGWFKHGAFLPSFGVAVLLVGGQFVFLLSSYSYIIITHFKRTLFIGGATILGVAATLGLAPHFLERLGMYGAAIATAVGLAVVTTASVGAALYLSRRGATAAAAVPVASVAPTSGT